MSVLVTGAGSRVGTGGMATKVQAAMLATTSGIGVQLASADALQAVLAGSRVGTWFEPSARASGLAPPLDRSRGSLTRRDHCRRGRCAGNYGWQEVICWSPACARCWVTSTQATSWTLPVRQASLRAACRGTTLTRWPR